MPQLDTVHILTIYLWTWLTLTLMLLKIKTFMMITKPKNNPSHSLQLTTPPLPWT
uniref:ATP synthase F0 subunit 8 n=1 Tax=Sistrurus catenatus edwardsii TaxID=8762 RepID=C0L666_SISCA|nr:ATP synthase F0 subunit 8 [Sistrurus catenatus edwardsi]ACN41820.1 ATP synthase F0 subunit 8 [Sistrurus catenatus edwardsi]ACN41822.1 ATP synthase F0 subunit 8 [Sistrurus catenatus edwardsi]AMW93082.1 ATP synthase F0 subunit 8 [Sistrurus catenatus edwardsi]AMW93090.1 ATP synthase F0 subunit 8 [Sistrurus catenatus edwardsi]